MLTPTGTRLPQLGIAIDGMLHETAHSTILDHLFALGRHSGVNVFA